MAARKQVAQSSVSGTAYNRRKVDQEPKSTFEVKKKVVEIEVDIKGHSFVLTDTEVRQLLKMLVDAIHKEGTPKLDRLPMKRIKRELQSS